MGDKVLAAVGELLRSQCREGDIAARFGGEELVLILVNCPEDMGVVKAESVREAIEELTPAGLPVTASLGIAALPAGSGLDFDDLFKRADEAVYAAKRDGRNRVELYSSADEPNPTLASSSQ